MRSGHRLVLELTPHHLRVLREMEERGGAVAVRNVAVLSRDSMVRVAADVAAAGARSAAEAEQALRAEIRSRLEPGPPAAPPSARRRRGPRTSPP